MIKNKVLILLKSGTIYSGEIKPTLSISPAQWYVSFPGMLNLEPLKAIYNETCPPFPTPLDFFESLSSIPLGGGDWPTSRTKEDLLKLLTNLSRYAIIFVDGQKLTSKFFADVTKLYD